MTSMPFNRTRKLEVKSYDHTVMDRKYLCRNNYETTSPNTHILAMDTTDQSRSDRTTEAEFHFSRVKSQVDKGQAVKQTCDHVVKVTGGICDGLAVCSHHDCNCVSSDTGWCAYLASPCGIFQFAYFRSECLQPPSGGALTPSMLHYYRCWS